MPAALDDDVVPAGTAMVRLSSSETERFEFTSVPDDVLIRRIAAHGSASWVMVFAGTIDRPDEARLTVLSDLCRDALNALTVEPIVTPEVEVVEHESLAAAPFRTRASGAAPIGRSTRGSNGWRHRRLSRADTPR